MDLGTSVQAQTKAHKFEVEDIEEPDNKNESGDWVQGTTDNGQIYYYNTTTGGQFLLDVLLHTVLPKHVNSCCEICCDLHYAQIT